MREALVVRSQTSRSPGGGTGMVAESEAKPVLPPMTRALLLIEKWAHHRGDATSRGGGIFVPGRAEPVVHILHGSAPIYVRDLGKCLMALGVYDIPKEVRGRLAGAPMADRLQFYIGLREILMSCPRVGFGLAPAGALDPRDLERVVLDQTFQIAENDPASFNRFCDAIQETETILLRVADFMHAFVPLTSRTQTYSSGAPPPSELYR